MSNQQADRRNNGTQSQACHPLEWLKLQRGEHRMNCPQCGRDNPHDKTMGVTVEESGAGVAHCFRCSYTESHKPERMAPGLHAKTPPRQHQARQSTGQATDTAPTDNKGKRTTLSDFGRTLWRACQPLQGTEGEAYLLARRCVLPPPNSHLRFHPALHHAPTGYVGPALVAAITNALTGRAMSLHRTWIKPNGEKANINPPRLLLGGHSKKGGVIRLWPSYPPGPGLAVGEGIETCLSLAHAVAPVWALVDAGNLAALPVVEGVQTLLIAQDRDPAGEHAARVCADRWSRAGVCVSLTTQTANDLNDCLQGAA